MACADEQSYEAMIYALQNFISKTEEQCTIMEQAGKDCVDNSEEDPNARKSYERLCESVTNIRATFETVSNVIAALQAQLEDIRKAAAIGNQLDD